VTLVLHLLPLADWNCGRRAPIAPESLAAEGFVHCTDTDETLLRVANNFYRSLEGPVLAITIDTDRVGANTRWEHPPGSDPLTAIAFPHIYGVIPRSAVVASRLMERTGDGTYTGYGPRRAVLLDTAPILPSLDLERTARWYARLGFELGALYPNQYLMVYRDGFDLHFFHQARLLPMHNDHGAYMWCDDAFALHAEWLAADAEGRLGAPERTEYGLDEGHYADPDGNLIRFGSPSAPGPY
jgi:uncharacterized protein (DUF952 family)/catechol 2,3-dioxygenase-like lactoylglutathione lyase family enzyme